MYEIDKGIYINTIDKLDEADHTHITHILNCCTLNIPPITEDASNNKIYDNIPVIYDEYAGYIEKDKFIKEIIKCMNLLDDWTKSNNYNIVIYTDDITHVSAVLIVVARIVLTKVYDFRKVWKSLAFHPILFNPMRSYRLYIKNMIYYDIFTLYLNTLEKRVILWKLYKNPYKTLNLSELPITELPPDLPENVYKISLLDTPIKTFKNIPSSVKQLSIASKCLESLEGLPQNLEYLYINFYRIQSFEIIDPFLPNTLKHLFISSSYIKQIDKLPNSLKILELEDNYRLVKINKFPNTLKHFYSNEGVLEYIDKLPDSLTKFSISFERIKSIPYLPPKLKILDIFSCCKLKYLSPQLPESLICLIIDGSPHIKISLDTLTKKLKEYKFDNIDECFVKDPFHFRKMK